MSEWTAADLPSFAGRTVIVTGANSGLGAVTARELARSGAQIIMAVRNANKGEAAAQQMTGNVEVRQLDLQDLSSVRRFADGVDKADILINNAGIMATPYALTADGFESQVGTNHLGHFALTNLLLPKLSDRVVTVSSMLHYMGRIDLDDLNWKSRRYSAWPAYGQSKLANLLFTSELQQRLNAAGSPLGASGPPRLLAHQLARALRQKAQRRGDDGRHPSGVHRRRFRRPANVVCGVAGFTRQHLRRPQVRLSRPHPTDWTQPRGSQRGYRHRALAVVRAAHSHHISSLTTSVTLASDKRVATLHCTSRRPEACVADVTAVSKFLVSGAYALT